MTSETQVNHNQASRCSAKLSMKRGRVSISSSSDAEGSGSPQHSSSSAVKPNSKTSKTESESESDNRAESGMEDQVSLKKLTNIIRLFKDETGRHFESLQNNMSEIRIQLQHDIKEVRDNLSAMTVSLDNAWSEVESMKSQLQCQQKEIETLQS